MTFWGRDGERKRIHKMLGDDAMTIALIYGRRRVGKSELIKQCLRETAIFGIYYECKQTTEMNNVESLAVLLSEKFAFPRPAFSGIEEVLEYLFRRAQERELILVLDEYSYLRDAVKGMDSILQSLADRYRAVSKLKLILCGSYIDTMKSMVLAQNPLFGRVDLSLDLKPMDYYDSSLFYSDFSDDDKVRLYSVFGGIPYYNRLVDGSKTVRENIVDLVASPDARLENEIVMFLKSELSKITNANEVFEALARGFSRYNDILSQSHVSSGPTLVDVLDKLIKMEVVKKEAPLNDENNRKKAGYYISDNLSLFYYKYIFRYLSQLSLMEPETFFDRYISRDFETEYVPRIFEDVCRQYLVRRNRRGQMDVPFEKIGRYYYDDPKSRMNGEFDIVTLDPQGYVFYEAKFKNGPVTEKMMRDEIAQVRKTGLNCYKYGFFSKSGFADAALPGVQMIDIHELYGDCPLQ